MTVRTAPAGAAALMDRLGHRFGDAALLELALTHRSWCAEHSGSSSNERLEFLGDAVLGLAVTQRLYSRFGHWSEGDLAKTRASLVNSATLAEVARSIGIGGLLRLGRGEAASGGRLKSSILADAVEAVIGAVYLDGGIDAADEAIGRILGSRLEAEATAPGHADFKTRLQELVARLGFAPPTYDVTTSGPAHQMSFEAEVQAGRASGTGRGSTKKDAEQQAAQIAFSALASEAERVGSGP
ncbi:MAG: ribonuclease III [Acidimicrobiaceae bacterium]|nr:ribonuclease III [Acidimicrobiaceae bacterium]